MEDKIKKLRSKTNAELNNLPLEIRELLAIDESFLRIQHLELEKKRHQACIMKINDHIKSLKKGLLKRATTNDEQGE